MESAPGVLNRFVTTADKSEAATAFEHDIVVLPLEVRGDVGIYSADADELAKELKLARVDAAYLHDGDHRKWRVLKGELPIDIIIGISEAVAGAAIWATIVAAFRSVYSEPHQIRSRLVRQSRNAVGKLENTMFEYEGTTEGFIEALAHLDELLPPESDSND